MVDRHPDFKEACAGARVMWGPTIVIADSRGSEVRRWVGWLPPQSFVAELAFSRALANHTHGKFAEALAGFDAIVEHDSGAEIHPEALYWQGVAGFMAGPRIGGHCGVRGRGSSRTTRAIASAHTPRSSRTRPNSTIRSRRPVFNTRSEAVTMDPGGFFMSKFAGGILSVDVGGGGIKGMVLDPDGSPRNEKIRVETPRPAVPEAVLRTIAAVAAEQPEFERVSIGFPGVVQFGVVRTAPNLDGDWNDVPLAVEVQRLIGKPCRAANDADVQGYGAVEGKGVEMVLTLGTGMGSAIFTNGHLVANLELGHHPFRKGKTYEELIGQPARKKAGNKKWSKRVARAIAQILPIWNPRILYLGGGNAKKLTIDLPENVKLVPNVAGILGGIRLWEDEDH